MERAKLKRDFLHVFAKEIVVLASMSRPYVVTLLSSKPSRYLMLIVPSRFEKIADRTPPINISAVS